jgi:hypothetical protein
MKAAQIPRLVTRFVLYPSALALAGLLSLALLPVTRAADNQPPAGFTALFNGRDFSNWKVPEGDNGHWKVVDGLIDYDAGSEANGDKSLWTAREYGDFVLHADWRIKETPYVNPNVFVILPDGTHARDIHGKPIRLALPDSDSGIFLRGSGKYQLNIWCWPIGSGEIYGVRMDTKMPDEVRAAVTPRTQADKPVGEWNHFEITVRGNTVSVVLNGKTVIPGAQIPALPARGPLALQHHGGKKDGQWSSPPALVQFKNIFIKELGSFARVSEPKTFSGPQLGEKTTPFQVVELTGANQGKEREPISENAGKPTALVFISAIERSLVPLLRVVEQYGAERADRLKTEFVFLFADRVTGEERVKAAANSLKLSSRVGLSMDGAEGPGNYGLNKECMMTILAAKDNIVTANFALVQPGIADAPQVIAALAKACGDTNPPTVEQLSERQVARAGGRQRMARDGAAPEARPIKSTASPK